VKLRTFETADTDKVLQLVNAYAFSDGPMHESDLAMAGLFPEGFIVAEVEGHIVGFVMGYFRDFPAEVPENWGVSSVGHIEILAVDSHYRTRGVGTALIQESLRVFKQAGADMVTLHCPADAQQAP
jgi:ribosomal protein S18 acetylase RimI-like enzyme